MTIINIADIVCPSDHQGRTYRQINAEMAHEIPLGSLVENQYDGTRAFVVFHGRDCDQTPLYTLSLRKEDVGRTAVECGAHAEGFRAPHWESGYPAEMLTVISRGD